MQKNAVELSLNDSVATLRLIKTLELETGQKRLVQKLHKNITDNFQSDFTDPIKSIDRAKDILKVPSGELHKSLLSIVSDNFKSIDPLFHMQLIVYLIKDLKMVESRKLNKKEKELEKEILAYMKSFIANEECMSMLIKASTNHRIKLIMLFSKFKKQDYISQVVTSEMDLEH